MLKLKLLAPAWKELEAVGDIHLKLAGPASAERITDGILDTLECLRSTPLLGMECEDRELKDKGYRRLICGNYLCFCPFSDACQCIRGGKRGSIGDYL